MSHRKSLSQQDELVQQVMDFNEEVFAFEDEQIEEMTHLITVVDRLQKSLHTPNSVGLLKYSLRCIQEAETQDEMEVYRLSFLAALELTKLHDVLDTDACIEGLQKYAADLFFWANLEIDPAAKQVDAKEVLSDIEKSIDKIEKKFNQDARELQEEFELQIARNFDELNQLKKVADTNKQKIAELDELILKYYAGIKKINTQKAQVARALETMKQIPFIQTKEQHKNLQDEFDVALRELRLVDKRAGYNHFVNKCKESVNALCAARSSYLQKEASVFKPLAQTVWQMSKAALPFLHAIHIPDSVPDEMPGFARESIDTGKDINAATSVQLGRREPSSLSRVSTFKKIGSYFKKAATILIAAGSFILSGLLCLTVIGIPKAVAIAAAGVGILNTVRNGSDFFTEYSRQIHHNKTVVSKIDMLDKKHEQLSKEIAANRQKIVEKSVQESEKKSLTSETKIDLLLMGRKPGDILSKSEMEKLAHKDTRLKAQAVPVVKNRRSHELSKPSEPCEQKEDKSVVQPKH